MGAFLEIYKMEPAMRQRAMQAVVTTIEGSFIADKSRPTQDETRRRFRIVEQWIRELRCEHGWAFVRIFDALPTALRSKLDGIPWDPTAQRETWAP